MRFYLSQGTWGIVYTPTIESQEGELFSEDPPSFSSLSSLSPPGFLFPNGREGYAIDDVYRTPPEEYT